VDEGSDTIILKQFCGDINSVFIQYTATKNNGTVLFNWKFKLRESLKFELGPPDSTQSIDMEVSECPDSGRVQHEQADDNVLTINRNKGKLFTVLGVGFVAYVIGNVIQF